MKSLIVLAAGLALAGVFPVAATAAGGGGSAGGGDAELGILKEKAASAPDARERRAPSPASQAEPNNPARPPVQTAPKPR